MHRKTVFRLTLCQLFLALACLAFVDAHAAGMDVPHDTAGCLDCHNMTSTYPKLLQPLPRPPVTIDKTAANGTCEKCHLKGDFGAPFVYTTHFSLATDGGYGMNKYTFQNYLLNSLVLISN